MTAVYAIPTCKLLNIKLVNGMIVDVPQQRNIKNKNWIRAKISFPFSDLIIGNSKAGIRAYGAPASKSVCIYNGFNFSRIEKLKIKRTIIDELQITTPFVIGMVATHSHYKDYKTYFKAAEILLAIRNDITFLAIGNQTDSAQAKTLVNSSLTNHFRLMGKQADVESYIQLMDICVLATFTEGISNSILEYMAMSKPVVATSGGGTNEIVIDNETGFLIPQSNPSILAEKLDSLLNNDHLRRQLGMEGRKRVQNHFIIKPMIDSYIYHYNKLLNNITSNDADISQSVN
jgi:glycosyltransferase involved in cell wall biosynthesis